jgi:universal stress protein E
MTEARLRSILAASDLAEGSEAALVSADRIRAATGAELHVFHCVPRPAFPLWEGAVPRETREEWAREAREELRWQMRRVLERDEPQAASVEAALGEPVHEIDARAEAVGADLVVLGSHRSRGPFDDLLGTTADRVIRTSAVPCLLANRPLEVPPRAVLLPTDFSVPARRAVGAGLEWLSALLPADGAAAGCTVHLLHVRAFEAPSYRVAHMEPVLAQEAERAREHLGNRARVVPRLVYEGMADDGIRRVAEQIGAELVVVGTHGYSALGRALLGSVASAVARTLPHPVLLVPPEHAA